MTTSIPAPRRQRARDESDQPDQHDQDSRDRASARPAPLRAGYAFELRKLLAQWRIRVVIGLCWIAPALFVGVVSAQSSLPADTVFGRWMHATGWAGTLVVLAFCCSWALPLLTSLVAGDAFAVEDRLGTWRHLVLTMRSPARIFWSKTLASLSVIVLLLVGVALSATLGGLVAAGPHPLVGLDGTVFTSGEAAGRIALAWLAVLAPTLAFAAVGLLGSVVLGRSPMGLLVPAVLALALNLLQLLPLPVAVRLGLPSAGFVAWRGLLTDPAQTGPLLVALAVDLAWVVVALGVARRLFVRRDFATLVNDGGTARALLSAAGPLVALVAVAGIAVATLTPASGTGVERAKLEASLSTVFAHLYQRQAEELHRPAVTPAQLGTTTACDRGGDRVEDSGPGTDWRCVVTWHVPGSTVTGSAIYQLDVAADGRYVADGDGPKEVNGFFTVSTAQGDAPNPLWQVDGLIDLLSDSH
ncbi:ABC transporter permease [Nocardioides sp.]|uniref:ABC transporter permease n=1 Tax=Nocardioides sp. TaxID=35761 RepID=UPI00261CFE83|nr:ABC transporter permease [Nocardioides sp.]